LIEACSDPGNVVFDCTAATGIFLGFSKIYVLPSASELCLFFNVFEYR
jgi:hypothetical protein